MTVPAGKVVVWGLLGHAPFGGMVWQVLHHLEGLRRLGLDVWYVEDSDRSVLVPGTLNPTMDVDANVDALARMLDQWGYGDRWVFRVPGTEATHGAMGIEGLKRLYREADAVFNLCGAQEPLPYHDAIRCLVLLETDPVPSQIGAAKGDPGWCSYLNRHDVLFTYGTNLTSAGSPIPATAFAWHPTVPPVVNDWWSTNRPPATTAFTTVLQWASQGKDVEKDVDWQGQMLRWTKEGEFAQYEHLAKLAGVPLGVAVRSRHESVRARLRDSDWLVIDAATLDDPDAYRAYIVGSRGEFSVAKHQYVASRSGWISDRTVCYLASGRPAIVQRTAVAGVPLGLGLVDFGSPSEADDALRSVAADYARHAAAARELAREHFDAEVVLGDVLRVAGLAP